MTAARSFKELIDRHRGHVVVACDTEFDGPHTLTAQFAARVGDDIVVQVYSSPAVPAQPAAGRLTARFPAGLARHCRRVVVRPGRRLDPGLSPVGVLADLFGLSGANDLGRLAGTPPRFDGPPEAYDPDRYPDGELTITLVAHFWPADFFRAFGREFFAGLLRDQRAAADRLRVPDRRLLTFASAAGPSQAAPVVATALAGGSMYAVRVRHFDTQLAFGGQSGLGKLAEDLIGVGKADDVSAEEKGDMGAVFRADPGRAYAYAALDPVLALLVYEQLAAAHRAVYADLGFAPAYAPPLPPNLGSRVSELVVRSLARDATGSQILAGRPSAGRPAGVKPAKVRQLLEKGGAAFIHAEHLSEFGEQTGQTHGGLCYSRSPTALFHPAPGQFRDVDLSGCYAQVMKSMSLYAGRPLVYEPGANGMTVREAVAFLAEHAAGRDAWVIKASGPVAGFPNALVPSTRDALTTENYKRRAAKRRAARRWERMRCGDPGRAASARDATANTALYTDVVEGGVVAWATWLLIRALPAGWREQYENLRVDTVLFYPAKLAAADGPGYDAVYSQFRSDAAPWAGAIDMGGPDGPIRQLVVRTADEDHVALRFDLGGLARALQERRRAAPKGTAVNRAWKDTANSLYGVLASPHMATNNVVAANVVTATARALAFAMHLSLNGVQVVTDGCTYRRDQVPAGTLADCLASYADYPIDRSGFAGPHLDPSAVPANDAGFADWYRGHVQRFFGVSGPEYDELFGMHEFEHKAAGGRTVFDGLCCDGSANYARLEIGVGGAWAVAGGADEGFKARSVPRGAKAALAGWVVRAYSEDRYGGPPLVRTTTLLKYKRAGQVARAALRRLEEDQARGWRHDRPLPEVFFPLGLGAGRVVTYKPVKLSAFLFRTPDQRRAWERAVKRFERDTGYGLELLAVRRDTHDRRQGSLAGVAAAVHRLVRAGERNPGKSLNLRRAGEEVSRIRATRLEEVGAVRAVMEAALVREIDAGRMGDPPATGLFVTADDLPFIF